tara:strand:+ start:1998 stop:3620 length:1623 start_codon:yes stop_codon:yes gene_type:complete
MFKEIFFSLVISIMIFVSCGNPGNKRIGDVFRYNEAGGISSLDPAFSRDQASNWITKQIFSTLVDTDSSLQILPNLALSWEVDESALVYDFFLRSDVVFHDSPCFNEKRYLTANDIVYSFERLMNPMTGSPGSWVLENVINIESNGLSHVTVTLNRADPSFLSKISMPYCGIVPFEAIEYYGKEFSSNPVGTGPFYFKNWRRSDKLVLRRNNFFYQSDDLGISLPYLEAVSIRFIPDRQAAFLEFVKGNLDFLTGIDASYKDQLFTKNGQLKERWLKEYNLYRAPFLNTEFIGIRSTNPSPSYLADSRVRRALNLSIDRISMIRYLKNGIGKAAYGGVIPIGLMGHRKESDWLKPFQYDMDTAISLLTQAGLSTGLNDSILDPIVLSTTSGYRDLCEYLQNAWGNIGIPVQINIMPAASFRDDKSSGSLPVYRASWIADYPDAENYLMLYESKRSAPNGPNSSQFKNKGFDSLLVLGKFATTDSMRVNSFQLADKQLHDESRLIPLIYDESIRVLKKEWRGLPTHPMNWLDLRRTRKLFN